jgi:hypothetical protein
MAAIVIWMVALCGSVSALIVLAAGSWHDLHLAVSLTIAGFVAIGSIRDHRIQAAGGASAAELAATSARAMGFLWCWSTIVVFITYTWILEWPKWVLVCTVLVIGAVTCVFISQILTRGAQQKVDDGYLVALVDWMAWGQFLLTCLAAGGLYAAGRLAADGFADKAKWAAINVTMASAFGINLIAGYLISVRRRPDPASSVAQ